MWSRACEKGIRDYYVGFGASLVYSASPHPGKGGSDTRITSVSWNINDARTNEPWRVDGFWGGGSKVDLRRYTVRS